MSPLFTLLCAALSVAQTPLPEESVKFAPTLKIYECPPGFTHRSDCKATEKAVGTQKLVLNLEVLTERMGQWNYQMVEPVPATFHVIVVRGLSGKIYQYSVSSEAGLTGSAAPFANGRVEFSDDKVPGRIGLSSAPFDRDGKKYLVELHLSDFHGKPYTRK